MHAGFGKRPEETGRPVGRYRASGRLYRPPTTLIVEFIDRHHEVYGVEPICAQLKELGCGFAPSSYYEARCRPESRRSLRDKELKAAILKEYDENYRCYGARKMWLELRGKGLDVARCTVERFMKTLGLSSRRVRLRGLVEQEGGHLRLTESAVATGVRTEPGTFDSVGPGSERVILGVQEEW